MEPKLLQGSARLTNIHLSLMCSFFVILEKKKKRTQLIENETINVKTNKQEEQHRQDDILSQ